MTTAGEKVAAALDAFGRSLYGAVASVAADADNVLLSPLSVATALAMTLAGADGGTARQLVTGLGHPADASDIHDGYKDLLAALPQPDEVELNAANRLYAHQSINILDTYAALLKLNYMSEMQRVDFSDAVAASKLINDEVSRLTKEKIKDLVPPSALSSAIRLVIVNAVHFKGAWEYPFKAEWTEEGDFFTPSGVVRAQLMTLDGKFLQASNSVPSLDCQAVELPFRGGRLAMLLLLPATQQGLSRLEAQLAGTSLAEVRDALHSIRARIVLPRFRFETGLELRATLNRLGITDLFEPNRADLSGMTGSRNLVVDSVLHKAVMVVDEQGCEAAAGSAVMMRLMAMRAPELIDFRADHPFLVVIYDRQTSVPLFMGRIVRP